MARYWGENILIYGDYVQTKDTGVTEPNPNKEAWERKTQDVLRELSRSRVGGLLLRQINAARRSLTIRPLASSLIGQTRAQANKPALAGEAGQRVRPGEPALANGLGSGATIWFDPDSWEPAVKGAIDPKNQMKPADVLLHECVHAYRYMKGKAVGRKLNFFENYEEFYAILITNIHVADLNRIQDLRGSHELKFEELGFQQAFVAPPRNELLFYFHFTDEIDELCRKMPELTTPLETIQTWNPIRARRDKDRTLQRFYGT